jgi:hypothetical protein
MVSIAYAPFPVHASNACFPQATDPVTRRKVRPCRGGLECLIPPELLREAAMEVLLLLLDEIDDFCLMVWQRTSMLLG